MSSLGHGTTIILLWVLAAALPIEAQSSSSSNAVSTLARDAFGQPHAFGSTDALAFYAYGRSQMRDFPVTVAMNLSGAAGELSSLVGRGPGKSPGLFVAFDIEKRIWCIAELAAAEEASLASADREILEAYVLGLNDERILALNRTAELAYRTRPFWFPEPLVARLLSRPFTLRDVIANGICSNGGSSMATAAALATKEIAAESYLRTHSNGWLMRGSNTASGAAITLADPHTSFEDHGRFRAYFASIHGATYDASGIGVPGMPGIGIGFTPTLSWVQTSNSPDIVDVWEIELAADGQSYLFDGLPVPILRETATIDVWDENAAAMTAESIQIAFAGDHSSPILAESVAPSGAPIAYFARAAFTSSPGYWPFILALGRARTVDEAVLAFQSLGPAYGNYLIADAAGASAYLWSGRVPVRGAPTPGTDWSMIQDGHSSAYRWQGFHALAELPIERVDAGSLAAADVADAAWVQNNAASDHVRPKATIEPSSFPDYMVNAGAPTNRRQERAAELLRGAVAFDFAKNEAIAFDDENQWMKDVRPLIHAVIADYALDVLPEVAAIDQMLLSWDLRMKSTSAIATIAELIRGHYEQYVPMLEDLGLYPHVKSTFDRPDLMPSVADFRSGYAWSWNRVALAVAVYQAAMESGKLLNHMLATAFDLPPSAMNPNAFDVFTGYGNAWGTAHYADLAGPIDPVGFAVYPLPGSSQTLFWTNTPSLATVADGMIYDVVLFGEHGHFLDLRVSEGSHALLEVELTVPPRARTLAALGPTEVTSDARRYARAADFSVGQFRDFPATVGAITSSAASLENFSPIFH